MTGPLTQHHSVVLTVDYWQPCSCIFGLCLDELLQGLTTNAQGILECHALGSDGDFSCLFAYFEGFHSHQSKHPVFTVHLWNISMHLHVCVCVCRLVCACVNVLSNMLQV